MEQGARSMEPDLPPLATLPQKTNVDHHRHVVSGMQINCSVQFHPGYFEWCGVGFPHVTASRRSLLDDYRTRLGLCSSSVVGDKIGNHYLLGRCHAPKRIAAVQIIRGFLLRGRFSASKVKPGTLHEEMKNSRWIRACCSAFCHQSR
jgi:hypothetical protein